jgi:16S rRNA processing protein RimM
LTSSTENGPGEGAEGAEARPVAGHTEGAAHRLGAGHVGRPHGLDGGFHVSAARPRLLAAGVSVQIGGRAFTVQRCGGTEQRPVLHLDGVEDRDAAVALRGLEITVAADSAPSLEKDEFWAHQLEGCVVHDGRRTIGTVARLLELPSCEVLEVSRQEGASLLVPMVKDAIRHIDVEHRRVDVDVSFLGETL